MATSTEIVMLNACALARAIKARQVSCVEVMDAYLDQIERLNPRVNAIVSLRDRPALLREAQERDRQLGRGEPLGWMHGFPHAVKDLVNTAGIRTTLGSPLFKEFVPTFDSIMVERIKRAGAIIIGKTNVPEFGLGSQTYNPVFGVTRNAYDQSRTSGGSSGGAAAALALRMVPLADGSDHAGSLRNPAAFNNVFGFRTSYRRVPAEWREVFLPLLSVAGPMARTVPDLAMFLSVLAGPDPRMPLSIREQPARFAEPLKKSFKNARIAWAGDFGGYLAFEPGVLELCENALGVLSDLGCVVEQAWPAYPLEAVWLSWLKLRAWQVGALLKDLYRDPKKRALMKPEVCFEIERGFELSAYDIADASAVRSAWYQAVREFFERYDYFVLPSAQVFPFAASLHWPARIAGRKMDTYHRWMEVAVGVSMAGCPALSVPAGFNQEGLPAGVQIVAKNHAERACLELAHAYDEATGWVNRALPPLVAP